MRLPKMPKRKRHVAKHRDEPMGSFLVRPHPVVRPGGSSHGTKGQRAREDTRYVGEHRRGKHSRPRNPERPRDPYAPVAAPRIAAVPRVRPVMGQPPRTQSGNARSRFGPPERVTDLAPAYRAQGVPARTPAEVRRAEARAAEWQRVGRQRRAAELRARVEEHEPPAPKRGTPRPKPPKPPKKAAPKPRTPSRPDEEEGKYGAATGRKIVASGAPGVANRSKAFGHKLDEPPAQHHGKRPAVERWFGQQLGRMETARDPGRHTPIGKHRYFDAT